MIVLAGVLFFLGAAGLPSESSFRSAFFHRTVSSTEQAFDELNGTGSLLLKPTMARARRPLPSV